MIDGPDGEDPQQWLPPDLLSLHHFAAVNITEDYIRTLPTSLTQLQMGEWETVTSDWMLHLSRLTNLQTLENTWTELNGDWISKSLPPQLKRLQFDTRGKISETDLISLPSGLKSIEISTDNLDGSCLRHLPVSVEKLSCSNLNEIIDSLHDRTSLRSVKLTFHPHRNDLADQLRLLPPNLQILVLTGFDRITKELLGAVPRHLRSLRLNSIVEWEGDFGPVMAELPTTLKKLTIWNGRAEALKGDEFLDAIPVNVKFLDLSGCWAHDATNGLVPLFSEGKLAEMGKRMKIILP